MSMKDILQESIAAVADTTLNRYRLDIPSCSAVPDVESLSGSEAVSDLYHYSVRFTTDGNISAEQILNKPATLTMGTGLLAAPDGRKVVHGVVTHFRRLGGSRDQVTWQITLEPFLALLRNQFRTHRFFVDKSVPEVVAQVLQEHGLKGWEYEFALAADYPKREQINQYQESDLAFIERLLSEVGIFYFFSLHPDTQTEVVHFADRQSAWTFGKTLPLSSPSGMSDGGTESVWNIHVQHNVTVRSVTAGDYNHREAHRILTSAPADMTRGEGEGITYGDVWHYRPRHQERGDRVNPAAETGNFRARLEHERFLSGQVVVTGSSSDALLGPAQVLTVTETAIPPTLPAETENGIVIIRAGYAASRKDALLVTWEGVPHSETRCWRPAAKKRPVVSGTLTARVTSAKENDIYAWQDAAGLYRVKFDADRDEKNAGQESMPVRLAKPYGGDEYGFHFPLIQGTEVAIAFHEGDPDRPYIAHALHDSRHADHVTEKNSTRNVIRTAGLNKLRMEDRRGEEHIKLSTEYGGKTQLNLGHNVDDDRLLRGKGAELRTDDWISIRGGKGVFISADAQQAAQGRMMDMEEAIQQLKQALSLATSLNQIVHKAEATQSDAASQEKLNGALEDLKRSGILAHAPDGIGIVSPESVRIASGGASVGLMSGKNTDISAGESITLAAANTVSIYAQGEVMQLFAGTGKMDIQAQNGDLSAVAKQDITISSAEGKVHLNASEELTITCGGAYIKLSGGNIELGAPGNILLKCTNAQKMGAATLETPPQTFPQGYSEGFTLREPGDGKIKPFTFFKITTSEGDIYEGVSNEEGKTMPIFTAMPSSLQIEFPDEKKVTSLYWTYGEDELPVSGNSRHYSDLNLHAVTESYHPGEVVDIEVDTGRGVFKSYQAKVRMDGVAVIKNIFSSEIISFKDEDQA
ncbi:type VI secretion system Vgr family protein [Kalamiella sp. sgz302252]|uniref:type VI secretion system Vgr family protein n=1 Tax=Pantoea sp. sgz302252 TaxID=3341827 RepID=UPI0036D3795E